MYTNISTDLVQQIQEAANHLSTLLTRNDSDPVAVEQILSDIRKAVLPKPTPDEIEASQRVEAALAAQRAVAFLRTEARLHKNAAERCEMVMERLRDAEQRVADREEEEEVDMLSACADFASQGYFSASFRRNNNSESSECESPRNHFRRSVIQPVETESEKRFKLAQQTADAAVQKELEFVRLRRKANSTVGKLMKDTEVAFNERFQVALQAEGGVEGADLVYRICFDVAQNGKQKNQKQPVPQEHDRCSPDYLQWLREEASVLLGSSKADDGETSSEFKDLVFHIAKEYNGEAVLAPVKGYKRTVEKVQEKYDGDYSRILDLARGMVVFGSIRDLSNALSFIKSRHDAQLGKSGDGKPLLLRAKDRLSPTFDAGKLAGGYRDTLLNLSFSSGHIVELQLHVASFLDVKNRRSHHIYEEARTIHMFNEAFTKRSYHWRFDSSEEEIEELLTEIGSGAITALDLDYSEALFIDENQTRLAEALYRQECRIQDLSLRSCFCGDSFVFKCLPLDDEEFWSSYHGHIGRVLRLGSKLHEGTGGRITENGIIRMVRYLNGSLRVLDLQGCLTPDWYENCGDSVANALLKLANELEADNVILMPQLQELNLRSTGLTPDGMDTLEKLKLRGHLGRVNILTDKKLRTGPPRHVKLLEDVRKQQ